MKPNVARLAPALVVITELLLAHDLAWADTPIVQQRCNKDALDPAHAEARLAWARKCALTLNVKSPKGFATGEFVGGGPGNPPSVELIEYKDIAYGSGTSYVGDLQNINSTLRNMLYGLGKTDQTVDLNGFYRWTKQAKLLRPRYPTFGSSNDIYAADNAQLYPHPNLSNCNLYSDKAGASAPVTKFYVNAYCESSCYTPEQRVLFPRGYEAIRDAVGALEKQVVTLSEDATLDALAFTTNDVYSYTAEFRDSDHLIYEIQTQSGGLLRVTSEHPVVRGDGRLVQARSIALGDEMIRADGSLDEVVAVDQTIHSGKVYNLKPDAASRVSHVLVAEGYLVGSSAFQNEDVDYINRILLTSSVPDELIPK